MINEMKYTEFVSEGYKLIASTVHDIGNGIIRIDLIHENIEGVKTKNSIEVNLKE